MVDLTDTFKEGDKISPCVHESIHASKFSNPSPNPSIRLSLYPSDLASMHISSHTGLQAHRQGCTHAHTITHAHTVTHLNPPIPPFSVSPSVAHIHTRTLSTQTLEHAHTYTYMYAYSPGPVAQLAAQRWSLHFSHNVYGTIHETQNNFRLQKLHWICIITQENHGKHIRSSIAMQILICR